MKITIINATPKTGWEVYESSLFDAVNKLASEHEINLFTIREMDINFCCGCWNCWVKTPGQCVFKDGMDDILATYPEADFFIFASPIKTGFLTSETKKVMDRCIPLVLPLIKLFDGECHHPQRYENEPVLGLLLYDDGPENESMDIIFSTIDRFSLNFHSNRTFKTLVKPESIKEVLQNEISYN